MADRVIPFTTCLGCGCACDDVEVHVRGGRIAEARNACELGVSWFGDGRVPARVRAGGRDVTRDAAIDTAARVLRDATRPLVYLAPDVSCEAQRETIALADALRAALDSVTSDGALASVLAAQERGRAGATLGEVRNRADVVVFWGVDPADRYPRYRTRYAPDPAGVHVADGRASRTVIAVDIGDARGPSDADERVAISPGDEVDVLTALALAARGTTLPEEGIPWSIARTLAPRLMQGRYVVIVADAEAGGRAPLEAGRAAALIALAPALNGPTRCALSTLRGGGNRSGADAVLTSQTGYPCGVDFSRGYPQYRPHDGAARARLSRGDVDAALVVGAVARMPDTLVAALAKIPCAIVGPAASDSPLAGAAAVIDTGAAGIHEGGTAVRMDDVPLPLRPALEGPASAVEVIRGLRQRIAARR